MRNHCFAALVAALLLAGQVAAQNLSSQPNDELCIRMAVEMIRGDQAAKDALRPMLEQRGETCAPPDMYLKIAEARLQFLQAQQTQAVNDAGLEEQRREDRAARIRAAGQAWLIYQGQQDAQRRSNTPSTTTCNTFAGTTTCNTR